MPLTNHLDRIPRNCYPVFYPDAASSRKTREEHLYLARSLFGRGGVVDFKGMNPLSKSTLSHTKAGSVHADSPRITRRH